MLSGLILYLQIHFFVSRRRMQKEMKSKLYSHFVKSGTLMGGNFTKETEEGNLEVFFYCF